MVEIYSILVLQSVMILLCRMLE